MTRKNIFFLILVLILQAHPVHAIKPARVRAIVLRRTANVSSQSARANSLARLRLLGLQSDSPSLTHQSYQSVIPARLSNAVFEVQISKTPRNTASAFALDIGDRTIGVTAAHVMEAIRHNPFAKVKTENGDIIAPITTFRIGNKKGNDIAIFEIPQEILPHIQVLSPARELPAVGSEIQSPRFVWGKPTFLKHEDIVFAGQHRILLRNQIHQDITGACGSPILVNGKVVGVHVGSFSKQAISTISWNQLLQDNYILPQNSFHVASPIEHAFQLAAQEISPAGVPLKVLGNPVHLMTPQEYLSSITLLRNGHIEKTYYAHPFMNFDKLEEFFELQENDVLRIQVETPPTITQRAQTWFYDVNVSTGKVSSFQLK